MNVLAIKLHNSPHPKTTIHVNIGTRYIVMIVNATNPLFLSEHLESKNSVTRLPITSLSMSLLLASLRFSFSFCTTLLLHYDLIYACLRVRVFVQSVLKVLQLQPRTHRSTSLLNFVFIVFRLKQHMYHM